MKKKSVSIILCIFLLAGSTISVTGVDVDRPDVSDILTAPRKFLEYNDNINISDVCLIVGPITSIYTEIELINGSSSDISRIDSIFKRIIPRFIFPIALIYVENLTFKISFKREPLYDNSRFFYMTFWGDIVNDSWENYSFLTNTIHTVTVTNFTGLFNRYRTRPFRLIPSYFFFIGEYEKIFVVA